MHSYYYYGTKIQLLTLSAVTLSSSNSRLSGADLSLCMGLTVAALGLTDTNVFYTSLSTYNAPNIRVNRIFARRVPFDVRIFSFAPSFSIAPQNFESHTSSLVRFHTAGTHTCLRFFKICNIFQYGSTAGERIIDGQVIAD